MSDNTFPATISPGGMVYGMPCRWTGTRYEPPVMLVVTIADDEHYHYVRVSTP